MVGAAPLVGVLALQGAVPEHARLLRAVGADVRLVRRPGDLRGLAGLVLPGGESTTISRLLDIFALREPLIDALRGGLPTLGTCAGLILLSTAVEGVQVPGLRPLGVLDVDVRRNAFGPQVDSAAVTLPWGSPATTVTGALIRAPEIVRVGPGVEITSVWRDATGRSHVVGVRSTTITGVSFHTELTGETSLHAELVARARA